MADKKIDELFKELFNGVEGLVDSKTVVGDAQTFGDTTIVPLVEVSLGMAAGGYDSTVRKNNNEKGAVGAKLRPKAVLVIKGSSTRIINVGSKGVAEKLLDLAPDLIDRFKKGSKANALEKEELIKKAFEDGE